MQELPGCGFPSNGAAATVPVVLPLTAPSINTGIAGGKSKGWVVVEVVGVTLDIGVVPVMVGVVPVMAPSVPVALAGLAEALVAVEVTLRTDGESATAAGVQLTLVPGIVGSSASGGEVNVVAGAPATVAAEKRLVNGLGPPSGDDMIAPGVVGIASAVVPMVDICAAQLTVPSTSITTAVTKRIVHLRWRTPSPVVMSLQAPPEVPPSLHRRGQPLG